MHQEIPGVPEASSTTDVPVVVEKQRDFDSPACQTCTVTKEVVKNSSALFTILNNEGCIDSCPRLKGLWEDED